MEDNDYLYLIEIVRTKMRTYDLSDLADDNNFLDPYLLNEGISKLPPPKEHLILLLEAFRFHLKWTDPQTVENNLKYFRDNVENGPVKASIQFQDREERPPFYLTELPPLAPLRRDLDELINSLRGEDYEPSPGMIL